MLWRRHEEPTPTATIVGSAHADLHDWVLSLPWVVERAYSPGTPGVRCFGIDCEPLGRRQLWLLTTVRRPLENDLLSVAVIVPAEIAHEIEDADAGHILATMPGCHALVTVRADSACGNLESLVLTAYGYALS